jgi:hypothetical protein
MSYIYHHDYAWPNPNYQAPESLENIVADYAIDGSEIPDLSFEQIQALRKNIGSLATSLVEVGIDTEGVLRLHDLAIEYGIFKRPGHNNFIGEAVVPDSFDELVDKINLEASHSDEEWDEVAESELAENSGFIKRLKAARQAVNAVRSSEGGSAGSGGYRSFLSVWRDYDGALGGGTPRKPLKVPGIVHQ